MNPQPLKIQRAVATLRAGGVIAYPTEAVWGFGCDPQNKVAVAQLLSLKRRSVEKGLILVAASVAQFQPYLEGLQPALINKFARTQERPVTWLVPVNRNAPDWITGGKPRIALRVSAYKPVRDLCLAFAAPIVSTSANISGCPTPPSPWPLFKFIGNGLDYLLPGERGNASGPSEIRDIITDQIIRSA